MNLSANDLMSDLTVTPVVDTLVAERTPKDVAEEELDAYCGFSAVEGHGHAKPEHYDRGAMSKVEVLYLGDVLEQIYGEGGWLDHDQTDPEVKQWMEENDAHFFAWEGYSFGSGAMEMEAAANAVALSKSKVVVEPLS